MDKKDFDIDFDFEEEFGLDPSLFDTSDDDDFDYDQFLKEERLEKEEQELENEDFEDFDMDEEPQEPAEDTEKAEEAEEEEFQEEAFEEEESFEEEEDLVADYPSHSEEYEEEPEEYTEEGSEEYEADAGEEDVEADTPEEDEGKTHRRPRRQEKKKFNLKVPKVDLSKIKVPGRKPAVQPEGEEEEQSAQQRPRRRRSAPAKPSWFSKFLDWYMAPVSKAAAKEKEEQVLDPLDPKVIRRKRRSKRKIFKEVYLPAFISGVCLFLILSFVVGSVANLIRANSIKNETAKQEAQSQASAAEVAEAEFIRINREADKLVQGYDYDGAKELLNSFLELYPDYKQEIETRVGELKQEQNALVEWKDVSQIPNLSFHVLIADPGRAFQKATAGDLAGSYNKNFVTTEEFSRILNQLYTGNFVLVDFDSFVSRQKSVDGVESLYADSMWLPAGKKPVMITETMVNYFEYMVDSNKDGEPDAGGHGFANRLVVEGNDIKAAYIDASGNESIGNYDLVPILEDFIKEHPDFSYRGARATLAVTGDQGVFGYRTNTSYVATKGQSYYDEQVMQAKEVVRALRDKGYTLASYTYSNVNYKGMSTVQIQAEMQNWTNQCTPVLGDVDVMVFARAGDIDAYSGTSFGVLYDTGFRYFLNSGTSPRVDVNTSFVKQTRLMVTGESMAWYSSQFTQYFDANMVLDLSSRGNVPRS